jgi:DNA-binding NtrC family response regulator
MGQLLKDLRYRFGACAIFIPPLRERREEIPLLAQRALERCPEATKTDGPEGFTDAAMAMLCEGDYPGNVRQLEGFVLVGYLMARLDGSTRIDVTPLPAELTPRRQYKRRGNREENRAVVERVLRLTRGNVKKAARLLGVSRNTLNAVRAMSSSRQRQNVSAVSASAIRETAEAKT